MTAARTNLLDLDRRALEAFCASLDEKPFRAVQLMKWIYHERVTDFAAMTNLSKALRQRLAGCAEIRPPELVLDRASRDGSHKWLVRLDSGNCIETVFIPEPDRGTLCVSSQIGCPLDCSFCATAQQGFNRNLTVAEIIGQVWQASRALGDERNGNRIITNIVLMGMGEPLLNFDNVVKATDLMQDDLGFGISKRRVTLSTAGVVPALYRLREVSEVSLAVSLHAPDDALRDRLVPLNRKYPIAELLAACRHYIADKPHRRITWEYVLLDGVNDSEQHARALVALLGDIPSKINLIPFNPFPGTAYRRSGPTAIARFHAVLIQHGLTAITRKTRGDDIAAACGQLAGQVQPRGRRPERRLTRLAS
ncbi:MAG: 23S rRNA (adenine(2503)-C(2))-methyltransferase RlmN [Candidatus Competibacteraceae bacterium]|nr:23S rRNA (adenine(2503)-C(2))-methyltransferase RlmN [Candidatus Competibacteraceae bacterium]MBK7983703.1 23S rRNA (adenine(2503)-C(2))-methyltransferase RlmN [Candidatus Competibacteraceae bacterium]MBK8897755.1 23S rRNA (adenine(2503)-C(2))-methyltransferase RlmN [Candidatus Competibacteraceae bacterium]MBK8961561.1 23S rRNA (adenine(2503)-C(2))-methyltransferase RlmN [Candidatus Competibacteraceae bacterium]MBK9950786.1 23S rRNA (adenine(2503)-C(2))-methyltransferase RlmN [Candidatus Com